MNYGDRTSGGVIFRSSPLDYDFRDVEQQKNLVRAVFDVETGWKIEQLRNALENAQEFYFDSISQVKAPSWSKGRVVLIGDAAHCSALLSGMGTSLGMLGAAALADELAASPDDRATAFYRYEEQIRPLVDRAQRSVGKNGDNLVPATAEAIASRNEQIVAAALAANNV
jgi:2-polyprenyl-6-methoxyphenol hydroxylase-like FAD-dependent oxidoreductase